MGNKIINVAHMMRKALNTLDYRLMDHGERVAYIILKMFQADGEYTPEQLTKISYMGMFHDIGAYQTEVLDPLDDISSTFGFEIKHTHHHAVYSYLFFKEHGFFEEFCDALTYHHFVYEKLKNSACQNKKLASRMFLADKIDILYMNKRVSKPQEALALLSNSVFNSSDVELLKSLEETDGVLGDIFSGKYLDALMSFLSQNRIYDEHLNKIVHMIPHAIDFRSEFTVTHTAATVEISIILAELFGMSEDEKESVYLGALLHDIGKISTSVLILEKDAKLTDNEFSIMKDHVLLTEYILRGCVSEEIVNIASRHHEKLDGTGYPLGLKCEQLTKSEKIVAVADILSALLGKRSYKEPFPHEKVIAIMRDLADNGKVCADCVDVAVQNFPRITEEVDRCSDEAMVRYNDIQNSAKELFEAIDA